MALVDSLLSAIVRADGDALVMHVGERPYVVVGHGHDQHLDARADARNDDRHAGAAAARRGAWSRSRNLAPSNTGCRSIGDDRFNCVAARGGDDIWIEIRRRRHKPTPPWLRLRNRRWRRSPSGRGNVAPPELPRQVIRCRCAVTPSSCRRDSERAARAAEQSPASSAGSGRKYCSERAIEPVAAAGSDETPIARAAGAEGSGSRIRVRDRGREAPILTDAGRTGR